MTIKGNKGEWSEIYTLFRLLGEGRLFAGDADMNRLPLFYPILSIIRNEIEELRYNPNRDGCVNVIKSDGASIASVRMSEFCEQADALFATIKAVKASSFEAPEAEAFMGKVFCSKLKAPSCDKSDIQIVIHDLRTGMMPLLGFSVKSQLGAKSTLLNASTATNMTYRIVGCALTDEDVSAINSVYNHWPRMEAIRSHGGHLEFMSYDNLAFKNNLLFVDYCLPRLVADCVEAAHFIGVGDTVKDVVAFAASSNKFGYVGANVGAFYEYKMKNLLVASALGMTPSKPWEGKYDATGGYIVVKSDGDIVCYHFYNKNELEDYLFANTKFERGDRGKHRFGALYRDSDGNVCIKLNLQIRFNN